MKPDLQLLAETLSLARQTGVSGNKPIGALVVDSRGKVIAEATDESAELKDMTATAILQVLRKGRRTFMHREQTQKFTLYCSLEPSPGESFFIAEANVSAVVYAAKNRFKPGISLLRSEVRFLKYFEGIELVEEPADELKVQSLTLLREYYRANGDKRMSKFFVAV